MKTFPIRLEDNLHRAMKHAALDAGMSLHDWILNILKQELAGGRYISNEEASLETTRANPKQ